MTTLHVTIIAGVLLAARGASADRSREDSARANGLFEAGRMLIDAGEIDLACDSFAASLELDPQLGTTLNLADCRERQGRLVEAHALFTGALEEAARTKQATRLEFARARVDALAHQLVEVGLVIGEGALDGLVVKLNGREVPRDRWNTTIMREPAAIVVEATAPGRAAFHAGIEGIAGTKVEIDVPALRPLPGRAATVAELETRALGPAARRPPSRTAIVVGGAGGALALGSIVLGLHARMRYHDERMIGLPDLNARLDGPQREADLATAMGIAGAVALGIGGVLYLRDRSDGLVISPAATSVSAGLTLMGTM